MDRTAVMSAASNLFEALAKTSEGSVRDPR